ncbi:hypothetical protein [Methylorubrum podarium]|jgi:hypothetical protein|uniref:hypothetical protein n=1 Tax=Methylorubrum podarium TaxID=200476 RepID=UPI001EE1AA34|nr:hypothetical protein [Methylorubrum podarium]GJE72048.1 hypothetical protein CHKEEEPN_3601 [Methylorubrum podarium]
MGSAISADGSEAATFFRGLPAQCHPGCSVPLRKRASAAVMPVWTKILVVAALAVILSAWGWMLDLSLSAAHAWLLEQIGHTGMRLLIGAMVFAGAWALWKETEDR